MTSNSPATDGPISCQDIKERHRQAVKLSDQMGSPFPFVALTDRVHVVRLMVDQSLLIHPEISDDPALTEQVLAVREALGQLSKLVTARKYLADRPLIAPFPEDPATDTENMQDLVREKLTDLDEAQHRLSKLEKQLDQDKGGDDAR